MLVLFFNFIAFIVLLFLKSVKTSDNVNSISNGLKGKAFHGALIELHGVGTKTAWAVLDVYPSSNDLKGVTIDQLKSIDGVSPSAAQTINIHFS